MSTLKTLDNIEAGVTLSFQQLLEVLSNARQEVLAIEQEAMKRAAADRQAELEDKEEWFALAEQADKEVPSLLSINWEEE